jgi:hypothetical protein
MNTSRTYNRLSFSARLVMEKSLYLNAFCGQEISGGNNFVEFCLRSDLVAFLDAVIITKETQQQMMLPLCDVIIICQSMSTLCRRLLDEI